MNSMVTAHWAQMTTGQAAEQDCCCTSLIIDIEFCHHSVTFCHLGINLELIPTYQFVMTRYMLLNPVSAQNYKRWPSVSVCWNLHEQYFMTHLDDWIVHQNFRSSKILRFDHPRIPLVRPNLDGLWSYFISGPHYCNSPGVVKNDLHSWSPEWLFTAWQLNVLWMQNSSCAKICQVQITSCQKIKTTT